MLASVSNVRSKVLAHHAMPVRRIRFVKELLDVFSIVLLSLIFVNGLINHSNYISLHVLTHFADNNLDVSFCHLII